MLANVRPFAVAVALLAVAALSQAAQFSELWGQHGEKYNPAGVLPDFSFAGYERGEKAIPERAAEVSVKSFGAVGDGKSNDTAAFKRAIEEAAGKVIGIPAGRYVLSDVLEIGSSGTVLKGAGADKTVLVFVKSLQELRPTSAETGSGKPTTAWSWSGGLVWFKGRNPVGRVLTEVEAPGAKRGDTSVPVADASQFKAGQDVAVSVKDDSEGSFVKYIFRDRPEDAKKLVGRHGYRYAARIREVKEKAVVLDRSLRFDLRPEWSASLCAFAPDLQQSGIEDLTFEFPRQPYRAHWEEDGYNAIQFDNCAHCWARRLVIHNSDSGIYLKGFFCTVSDVVFTANRRALSKGETGHHGIEADGVDNLVTRFQFKTRFFHEITVSHALGNVISDGSGVLLTLDHHKGAPYENLFTNLDTGEGGPEIWKSGGPPGVGLHCAAGATFWNIRGKRESGLPPAGWGPSGLVFVGLKGVLRKSEQRTGWHYEPIQPGALSPPNLHLAQLARRLATNGVGTAPASQRWTTITGQAFEAKFGGISGANVIFILPDGRRAFYPLASLSVESRAAVNKLATPR
ncbi:MAG: hypothetical protein HZC54_05815 [Verrucomicrobia bacterium]|nr:hypothetical protein [Verrucomicrobiota bacterium]